MVPILTEIRIEDFFQNFGFLGFESVAFKLEGFHSHFSESFEVMRFEVLIDCFDLVFLKFDLQIDDVLEMSHCDWVNVWQFVQVFP